MRCSRTEPSRRTQRSADSVRLNEVLPVRVRDSGCHACAKSAARRPGLAGVRRSVRVAAKPLERPTPRSAERRTVVRRSRKRRYAQVHCGASQSRRGMSGVALARNRFPLIARAAAQQESNCGTISAPANGCDCCCAPLEARGVLLPPPPRENHENNPMQISSMSGRILFS